MLTTDNDTISIPFSTKSKEVFPLDKDQLDCLDRYRQALDTWLKGLNYNRIMKMQMFEDSQRVVKFIRENKELT